MSETITRKSIVFLATAWGARFGGINSFNMDLSTSLANLLGSSHNVYCIVLEDVDGDVERASKFGVNLLSLNGPADRFDERCASQAWQKLAEKDDNINVEWWIGHDVISGQAANVLPEISGQGCSAVIKHMSYIDYCSYKHSIASSAQEKHRFQETVFRNANKLFAVGPLLRDSLTDLMTLEAVTMLIPGLIPDIHAQPTKNTFSAITFGRLDPENDKIKQPTLAVAAFSAAIRHSDVEPGGPDCLKKNPRMYLYGISESGGTEEAALQQHAREIAGKAINLISLPYTNDREDLFKELSRASVALMLSWHEGFGLTGWEAISAEVPLIIGINSGLYQFIDETLFGAGTGCIFPVTIGGEWGDENTPNYTEPTLTLVQHNLINCANNIEKARKNAKLLKEQLVSKGYTWDNTARIFAEALQLDYSTGNKKSPDFENAHYKGLTIPQSGFQSVDTDQTKIINDLIIERKRQDEKIAQLTNGLIYLHPPKALLSLMRQVVCYNQGEYAQYSFLAGHIHKMIESVGLSDTHELPVLHDTLSNFLNRSIIRVSKENFLFLKKYFHGRNTVYPRVCIKGSIRREDSTNIVQIVRDNQVNYFSEYPIQANSAFVFVNSKGTYFLCNDIPKSVAEGTYINSRIDLDAARKYVKDTLGSKKKVKKPIKGSHVPDKEWQKCWHKPEALEDGKNELDASSCYKSTLIVPMTLWNVDLDPMFRESINGKDVGRTIFGYLCLDHVDVNYFKDADIDIGYIFADLLSLYLITRANYIE